MRFWTALLSLLVASAVVASAPAQEKKEGKEGKRPHMTLKERFDKMDANHDGALSEEEFVAGHSRMGEKAKDVFKKMGGTAEKGVTFEQYKKAMEEFMKGAHKKREGHKPENK